MYLKLRILNFTMRKDKTMEARLRMVISAALTFSLIGFVLYLLIILTGLLGHGLGISVSGFELLLIILSAAALVTFGICFYTSCYQKWRRSRKTG